MDLQGVSEAEESYQEDSFYLLTWKAEYLKLFMTITSIVIGNSLWWTQTQYQNFQNSALKQLMCIILKEPYKLQVAWRYMNVSEIFINVLYETIKGIIDCLLTEVIHTGLDRFRSGV